MIKHIRDRIINGQTFWLEMHLGLIMAAWGSYNVYSTAQLVTGIPSSASLSGLMPLWVWGLIMLVAGSVTMAAALLDWRRWRIASAAMGSVVWAAIAVTLWASPVKGPGVLIIPLYLAGSLLIAFRQGARTSREK